MDWANRLIAFNKLRHAKICAPPSGGDRRAPQFQDEIKEAKTVVGEIAARIAEKKRRAQGLRHPLPHERAAAVVRNGAAAGQNPLRADGRHVVLRPQGGPRHLWPTSKVLAYPADEPSLLRIINVPPRGIGATTVKRLMDEAVQRGKPSASSRSGGVEGQGRRGRGPAVARFHTLIERFRRQAAEHAAGELSRRWSAKSATARSSTGSIPT